MRTALCATCKLPFTAKGVAEYCCPPCHEHGPLKTARENLAAAGFTATPLLNPSGVPQDSSQFDIPIPGIG